MVRAKFGLSDLVLVGDRGMIAGPRIAKLRRPRRVRLGRRRLRAPPLWPRWPPPTGRCSCPCSDQANLAGTAHPDYPGERLVACRNPALADERARKRAALLGRHR